MVWDLNEYAFLGSEQAPPEVNPSLVAPRPPEHGQWPVRGDAGLLYQIRGIDLANMTIVEGERGIIVIDALTNAESAAAALALYRAHRGERPVTRTDLHPQPLRTTTAARSASRPWTMCAMAACRSSRPTSSWRNSASRWSWPAFPMLRRAQFHLARRLRAAEAARWMCGTRQAHRHGNLDTAAAH